MKLLLLIALLLGVVIGFYTPYPKECLQYFSDMKPIYNLNCILEEAQRQAVVHDQ